MDKRMTVLLISYSLASLAHFTHNAEFLSDYPNMPEWLSRAEIYGTWLVIAVIGLAGYALCRLGIRNPGLVAIALYGLFGLDGLTHYWLAPIGAHGLHMNTTIWLEAITGVMLALSAVSALSHRQPPHPGLHAG